MIRKMINDPLQVVPELLEGLVMASNGSIRSAGPVGALVRADLPEGKVGLLIGGGSGHEPLFPAFIGPNMGDGAACGNIFAAPTPDVILAAIRAVHRGRGVVMLYGNYAGDIMNFEIAAEMAAEEGIETRTVRVWDDVASAPPERINERRGIAGDLFVIKIAGAAAATIPDLKEVYRVATRARDNTRSIGVALAAGSIPQTREKTFELAEDEIEIGMGLHGETGVRRQKFAPVDTIVEQMMLHLLSDLPFTRDHEVCMLVNDLGSTTMMELLIANRRARQILDAEGIRVYDTIIGTFCTCQEMAGFSITLLKLDEELRRLYDMPARSLGFTRGRW
ncbi:MAG: dihydroxyacetone kinase subunit DhaK [Acidobacteria bacterium]|nr:dihydroxyacetone kinase subunit DhaK [Acidobacteriota bacterium]